MRVQKDAFGCCVFTALTVKFNTVALAQGLIWSLHFTS